MSLYAVLNVAKKRMFGGVPFGNAFKWRFGFSTNSVGGEASQAQISALQIGDVIELGILEEGMLLLDSLIKVSTAFPAGTTCSLGFAYVSGVDSAVVPQSATYFGSGISLATAGTIRNVSSNAPVTLPSPQTTSGDGGSAYLILTITGANQSAVGVADVIVDGILTGAN